MFATGSELYLPPWSRIHPYISGTFLAWLICHRDLVEENRFQVSGTATRTHHRISYVLTLPLLKAPSGIEQVLGSVGGPDLPDMCHH